VVTALLNGAEVWRGEAGAGPDAAGLPADAADAAAEKAASGAGPRGRQLRYALALGFGLIHGMGFSNFLRAALGGETSIVWPLFAFNVGLEIGQPSTSASRSAKSSSSPSSCWRPA